MIRPARAVLFALVCFPSAAGAQTIAPPFDDPGPTTPAVTAAATLPATTEVRSLASALAALRTDALRFTLPPQQPPNQPRKDSLWNGVIVGAVVGGMTGTFLGLASTDCYECAGFNVPLTLGVIGAGAGAGIGAALDAMRQAHSSTAGLPTRRSRVHVAPVVGKRVKAMVARIHF